MCVCVLRLLYVVSVVVLSLFVRVSASCCALVFVLLVDFFVLRGSIAGLRTHRKSCLGRQHRPHTLRITLSILAHPINLPMTII